MLAIRRSLLTTVALLCWASPAAGDVTVFETKTPLPLKLELYGWLQPRFTVQEADNRPQINLHPNPAFTVQRARLGTIASLGKWARAQFEIDFSREIANPVDVFVVLTAVDEDVASLNLTLGQFRVPFSRQNLLPSKTLQFNDLAYFVSSKFIVDRDIGGMLWGDLLGKRARWSLGVFNGNEPGRGQTQNSDPYFLWAARVEGSPLGPAPRFEGDLRPLEERSKPVVTFAASAMRNRFDDKHFNRNYFGVDAGAWYEGASLYGEFYYHVDEPLFTQGPNATTPVKQIGWNVQAGYFPPIPFVREHVELAVRVAQLLTLSARGNHDNHTALFFGNLVLPQQPAKYPNYGELFFSVDVGPVHVVVIDDAWIVTPQGDSAYKDVLTGWLTADLDAANKNRGTVPWIVTMHHHPEYSSSLHGKDPDVLRGREYFAPIWDKYHVDMVFNGHDHDYERSKPLTGPTDNPTIHTSFKDGTVYVVCAGSGADGYSSAMSTFTEASHDYKNGGALGLYGMLTVDKASLKLEAHELRADKTDPIIDTVTITK